MRPIGGYFGLEVPEGRLPYPNAVPVNFGRGGLELVIRSRGYHKIWIPDYICPVVPEFLSHLNVAYEIYEIDAKLEPKEIPTLAKDEAFLYVNYFGIKDAYCRKLERKFANSTVDLDLQPPPLILDLTQAFYYEPTIADGFNSARKFFGVPDGGFVFGKGLSDSGLPDSVSYDRCSALLHRLDGDVPGGYTIFQKSDESFRELSVSKMSILTRMLLASIDPIAVSERRQSNFAHLHASLASTNQLASTLQLQSSTTTQIPLIYPYLVPTGGELRKKLIGEKVFCPTYWRGIEKTDAIAANFVANLVCIPVDQRYGTADMNRILEATVL